MHKRFFFKCRIEIKESKIFCYLKCFYKSFLFKAFFDKTGFSVCKCQKNETTLKKLFLFILWPTVWMPHSIHRCVRGGSCQLAEISSILFRRGCILYKYHMDEKKLRILSNLKYFYHKPSKNRFFLSAGVFWIWLNFFFYIWPDQGKKMILSKYLAVGAIYQNNSM